jgi:phosphohistidine phosphatase
MKAADLILWRHADAQGAAEDLPDAERALTSKGERQAVRMAQWLNRELPASTRVLVSPARRAIQTADALERKYKIVPALGPGGSFDGFLHAVRWPDPRAPVLAVGHQATLGLVAAYLLLAGTHPLTVRKGAIWWLRRREREGGGEVIVQTVLAPDRL